MSNETKEATRWWKASSGEWYPLDSYPATPRATPGDATADDGSTATITEVRGRRSRLTGRAKHAKAAPQTSRRAS